MTYDFADRLVALRKRAGLSQEKLAELSDVNRVTIAKYEGGAIRPKYETISKLANALNVSADMLLADNPIDIQSSPNAVRIPVLGSIPAGVPLEAITDIVDWEEIPLAMTNGGKEYFALRVSGNSMIPEYRNGDIIIVRQQEKCESGQDAVVMVNGEDATFKRVKITERGVILQSINPDYDSYAFSNAEVYELPVRILGVVVELRRKF